MNKKYSQRDIQKGFKNLALLRQENLKLQKRIEELRTEVSTYKAKEVGAEMVKMGYNNREANAVISMLGRCIA
ncbi:MAG: hypothetical protein NE330_02910 [Lentisphaeraceae bacterium]|nr:hypothetical protein [Lentisphaeraceae bacterium]